jgi:peptidyl-tRNA hydrolase, PTH1 family
MKIIVGLGNPGSQYENTRHNIGFAMMDRLQRFFGFPDFSFNKKFNAEISEGIYVSDKIILVKPQTFMNLSGVSVRALIDFYKLTPDDIIVIQDDIDIEIGTYRIAADSRSAGHNGIQNIIDTLGTQKFKRLRIGIGATAVDSPACRIGAHDFVLGKFSEEEKKKIDQIFDAMLEELKKLL